jgi:sugar phosphate isomerase/epimerase
MLTVPFAQEGFDVVMDFAEEAGIPCLEVFAAPGSKHIDPDGLTKSEAEKIKEELNARALEITALAYYEPNITNPDKIKDVQNHAKKALRAAKKLDVPVVGMLAGFPAQGMTKIETIREVLPKAFKPILTEADKQEVNIALENWFQTCLQGIDTFEALFEAIDHPRFGLNYDPSHLYHQECDYFRPVSMFPDRIFHTHAKDTLVNRAKRAEVGIYAPGWWRYVIPGFGGIAWGEFITHLRMNGYDGVMSIEHEDPWQSREEGFARGALYLEQFM